jgi:hypothetical protein
LIKLKKIESEMLIWKFENKRYEWFK